MGLPRALISQVVEFLLRTGLWVEADRKLQHGPKFLEIAPDSPMLDRHLMN